MHSPTREQCWKSFWQIAAEAEADLAIRQRNQSQAGTTKRLLGVTTTMPRTTRDSAAR